MEIKRTGGTGLIVFRFVAEVNLRSATGRRGGQAVDSSQERSPNGLPRYTIRTSVEERDRSGKDKDDGKPYDMIRHHATMIINLGLADAKTK